MQDSSCKHVKHPPVSSAVRDGLRLFYLTNISSPYRIKMVEAWVNANPNLNISVRYTDQSDQGRGWTVRNINGADEGKLPVFLDLGRYGKLNRGLFNMVHDADLVMIGGFEQASYLISALFARLMGKPVILLLDGFSPARFQHESLPVVALKWLTAKLCNSFFANGKVGRRYLEECIAVNPRKPIFNQFLSHDDEYIAKARDQFGGLGKVEIRDRLGLPTGRPILLSCGYLIRRKRVDLVIEALARIPLERRPLLLIVGSGPLRESLEQQANRHGVDTHFTGFKQGVELAQCYFASDAMVLASEDDPWGLVVNEAMSAGLPVVVSDACGAAEDLVLEGRNGFVFRNMDVSALADSLERLMASDMTFMGHASREMIQGWTPQRSATNLALCVDAAIGRR